ncbi:NrtA/SsuA/CpmA family ABC transporter substrate-binding protein [Streptomyces sp. INA 01156]
MDLGKELGGTTVTWPSGFTASLPVMEALKAGSVDFTFATATAVAYAIGGGVPIVPLAAYPLPANEVEILVPQNSTVRGAADLKGKRVADQQGTTGTYSLIKYLQTAGLRLDDVEYVNLRPPTPSRPSPTARWTPGSAGRRPSVWAGPGTRPAGCRTSRPTTTPSTWPASPSPRSTPRPRRRWCASSGTPSAASTPGPRRASSSSTRSADSARRTSSARCSSS